MTKDHTLHDSVCTKCPAQASVLTDRKEIGGSQALGRWEGAPTASGRGISFRAGEDILESDGGAVAGHCEYTKNC